MSLLPSALRKSLQTAAGRRTFAAAASSDESLVKTALNELHKELGGDMVPFAGYELPVLYKGSENGGVMKEHLWCRSDGKASLFDVSHMGQVCMVDMASVILIL
jgi:aminomethyltransferase